MKKIAVSTLFFINTILAIAQHDAQYSQYMFNRLVINPATAGSYDALSIALLHRNQWTGFEGAPITTTLSADSPLKNKKLNLGINIIADKYGVTSRGIFNANFAYRIIMKKSSLAFGIKGGIERVANNFAKIITTEQGDNSFSGETEKQVIPVAGFGVYYQSQKFYSGLSFPSLLKDTKHNVKQYKPILFTSGYVFSVSSQLKLKPSILIKYIKDSPLQADLNINAYYKILGLGISYRTRDAIVFLLHYYVNDQFTIGYSYDASVSRLRGYSGGSHELMIKYDFSYKLKARSPRYF